MGTGWGNFFFYGRDGYVWYSGVGGGYSYHVDASDSLREYESSVGWDRENALKAARRYCRKHPANR